MGQDTQPTSTVASTQKSSIEGYLKILKSSDSSFESRLIAARALMDVSSDELVTILSDSRLPNAQLAIVQVIAERDEPADNFKEPLVNLLIGGDPSVQKAVPNALGRYRDRPLVDRLKEEASQANRLPKERLPIIEALGKIGSKYAAEALIQLMKASAEDPNSQNELQVACAKSLFEVTGEDYGPNIAMWEDWWQKNQSKTLTQWLRSLLDRREAEKRDLADRLVRTEKVLIKMAIEGFGQSQIDPKGKIQEYLSSDLPALRSAALKIIGGAIRYNPTPPALQPDVRKLISDPDANVRRECAVVLRDSNDVAAVSELLVQLDKETDLSVKQELLISLGQLGGYEQLSKIIQCLDGPEPVALGASGAIEKVFVANGKADIPEGVRTQVVETILKRYPQATGKLKQNLLRDMAIIADKRFQREFEAVMATDDRALKLDAIRGLLNLNDPTLWEMILNYSDDLANGVRKEIATRLDELTWDPRAVGKMLDRTNPNVEKDPEVRQAAESTIVRMIKHWPLSEQLQWVQSLSHANHVGAEYRRRLVNDELAVELKDSLPTLNPQSRSDVLATYGYLWLLLQPPATDKALECFRDSLIAGKQIAEPWPRQLIEKITDNILLLPAELIADLGPRFLDNALGVLTSDQLGGLVERFVAGLDNDAGRSYLPRFALGLSSKLRAVLPADCLDKINSLSRPQASSAPASVSQPTSTQPTQPEN
jgi:HEAT repeat protein